MHYSKSSAIACMEHFLAGTRLAAFRRGVVARGRGRLKASIKQVLAAAFLLVPSLPMRLYSTILSGAYFTYSFDLEER